MSSTFPRTRSSRRGYDTDQVEEFLEDARRAYTSEPGLPTTMTSVDIRRMAFDLVKGGYSPVHVDAALERLEDAFAQRERATTAGSADAEAARMNEVRGTAQIVLARLSRDPGHRFSRTGVFTRGYAVKDVDAFADRLTGYFQRGEAMSIEEVRTVAFREATRGYDETQVDYLLETVTQVMLAVR